MRKFEADSGVTINRWSGGSIGKAGRLLVNNELLGAGDTMKIYGKRLREIADRLETVAEEYPFVGPKGEASP